MIDIAEMLIRGHNFDVALKEVLDVCPPFKPSPRQTFAAGLAMVAIEHGDSFRLLLRMKHFTSALALVRSQFEAVLRGYWVFFSAEEQWIQQMDIAANSDNAPDPEFGTIPSLLTKLAKSDDSSAIAIAESLSSLNQIAIKRFNSLTHGGRYPVVHALVGPRPEDLAWMIRTTSSLSYIAAQLDVRLAGYVASSSELLAVRNNFKDCMHSAS